RQLTHRAPEEHFCQAQPSSRTWWFTGVTLMFRHRGRTEHGGCVRAAPRVVDGALRPEAIFAAVLPARVRAIASGWALQLLNPLHRWTERRCELVRRWRGGGPPLLGLILLIGKRTLYTGGPAERVGLGWIHRGAVKRCRHKLRPRLPVRHERGLAVVIWWRGHGLLGQACATDHLVCPQPGEVCVAVLPPDPTTNGGGAGTPSRAPAQRPGRQSIRIATLHHDAFLRHRQPCRSSRQISGMRDVTQGGQQVGWS